MASLVTIVRRMMMVCDDEDASWIGWQDVLSPAKAYRLRPGGPRVSDSTAPVHNPPGTRSLDATSSVSDATDINNGRQTSRPACGRNTRRLAGSATTSRLTANLCRGRREASWSTLILHGRRRAYDITNRGPNFPLPLPGNDNYNSTRIAYGL